MVNRRVDEPRLTAEYRDLAAVPEAILYTAATALSQEAVRSLILAGLGDRSRAHPALADGQQPPSERRVPAGADKHRPALRPINRFVKALVGGSWAGVTVRRLIGDLIGRVSAVMLCVYESLVRLARYSVGRRCRLRRCSDAEGLVSFVRWSCLCTG
jgi:hypothetical protein